LFPFLIIQDYRDVEDDAAAASVTTANDDDDDGSELGQ